MNYHPNLVARSLKIRKTHVLGVIVPDLSRSLFAEVTKGIDMVASAQGYNLVLCNTGEDPSRENDQIATLVSKREMSRNYAAFAVVGSSDGAGGSFPWTTGGPPQLRHLSHLCEVLGVDFPTDNPVRPGADHLRVKADSA